MKKPRRKRRIESRPIDSLKPHPSQTKLFDDLSDVELQRLADDVKKNGLRTAVEILTDGTIIAGHQRVRAFQLLGRTEVRCWLREDLEQQGDDAIEARVIEDNLNRRQLSPLGVARCYLRLKVLEADEWNTRENGEGDLRDHLAERFSLSGRQLDRYAKMLDAPLAVQFAFERNELTQNQVLVVVKLDADEQQEIAERIENGEVPTEVMQPYMQRAKATAVSAETAVFQLVRALNTAERQLKHRCDEVPGMKLKQQVSSLKRGQQFIVRLRKHLAEAIKYEESIGDGDYDE